MAGRLDPAQRPRRRPTRHRDQLTTQPATARPRTMWNTTGSEARRFSTPAAQMQRHHSHRPAHQRRSVDRGLIGGSDRHAIFASIHSTVAA